MNPAYVDLTAVAVDARQLDRVTSAAAPAPQDIQHWTNRTFLCLVAVQAIGGVACAKLFGLQAWAAAVIVLLAVVPAMVARSTTRARIDAHAEHLAVELSTLTEQLRLMMDHVEATTAAKREFFTNASHELRTPLNAITLYSQLLYDNAVDQHRLDEAADLAKIQLASRRLLGMINQLLNHSTSDAEHVILPIETFDMKPMVEELAATGVRS